MAGRIIVPDLRAFDSNGDPISGAKLYSYVTGTTTNLATYTTSALSVAHTNPIIADSAGRFADIWAAADIAYRIVVKTAADVVINDTDPVVALGTGVNPSSLAKSADYTSGSDDVNRTIYWTGTATHTLPLGSSLTAGWRLRDVNEGTGTITVATQGGNLINGASTKAVIAGTTYDIEWTGTAYKAVEVSAGTGRHSIWIPIDAMIGRITNGPGVTVDESTTNKQTLRTLDFDASTIEYAQFRYPMPKSWDEGTVTFRPRWRHGATTVNFKTSWGLQGLALSDDDAIDTAYGTAQFSNDTGGTTDDLYVGPESAAITIAGTPQAEDSVLFQVFRKADDATNDTLAIDARLLGIDLIINTNVGNDA